MTDELFADVALKVLVKNKHAPYTLGNMGGVSGIQRLISSRKFVVQEETGIAGARVGLDALLQNRFGKLTDLCKAPYPRTWLEYEVHDTEQRLDANVGILIDGAPRSIVLEYVVQKHQKDFRPTLLPVVVMVGVDSEHPVDWKMNPEYKSVIVNEGSNPKKVHIMENVRIKFFGEPDMEMAVSRMVAKMVIATLGIMALVNVVSTTMTESKRKTGHRLIGGKLRPYFNSTTVTISLPTKKVLSQFGKALKDPKFRMRRHEVRGHFRHYLNADGTLKHRKWVENYDRGDASLGWVRHNTYSVEGAHGVALPKVAYQSPTERS